MIALTVQHNRAARKSGNQLSSLAVVIVAAFVASSPLRAQDASGLIPRMVPEKPVETRITPADEPSQVILKFREGSYVRWRDHRFVVEDGESTGAPVEVDLSELEEVLVDFGIPVDAIERLHTRPESELETERQVAQGRSGRQLADLNLYYKLSVPPGVDVGALCDQLNSLPIVELATPAPRPAPPPIDPPRQISRGRKGIATHRPEVSALSIRRWSLAATVRGQQL